MNREVIDIAVDSVVRKRQTRMESNDLQSLAASIRNIGLLYPILLDRHNVLIAGGRRLEACRQAALTTVPAIRFDVDYRSAEALAIQADENLCRQTLTPEELDTLIQMKKYAAASHKGMRGLLRRLFHHD